MKTMVLPEELHKEIMKLKLEQGEKNIAQLVRKLLAAYKEKKFLEHSRIFNERLKKSGKSFEQFMKEAREIREEVANEQFPD